MRKSLDAKSELFFKEKLYLLLKQLYYTYKSLDHFRPGAPRPLPRPTIKQINPPNK